MKALASIFILVSSFSLFAQEKLEFRTCYYDKENNLLENSEGAYYYRYDTVGAAYGGYYYYVSTNKLKGVVGPGEADEPRRETWYYENGNKEMDGTLQRNFPVGNLSMWYSSGQKKADLVFPTKSEKEAGVTSQIINYWDSLGTHVVTNGNGSGELKFSNYVEGGNGSIVDGRKNGMWKGNSILTGSYEETYDRGKIVSGVSTVDGKTYKYTSIEEPATLVNGIQGLYKDISKTMKYPSKARRERAQGTVYVEFVVGKDGITSEYKVIKGFHPACDAEALRTLTTIASKWNPGLHRGVPVKVRFVMPIKFVLG